ncbi:MAG: amidohydrolase [Proteobacteria bacterium]|nr:amidohydrolase [Pseudomonadota bacterium]MBI3496150.1 amidohydrolase [Pseudomonadota bacterium]
MTLEYEIVDCHGHIFPPLAGACGFPDAATHLLHQQRAMHVHGNQPYRRRSDHAAVTQRDLWQADDPSEAGRATDVGFRVGRFGRFEWERAGEGCYVQFLPPHMHDLHAPPEGMAVEMTYAGIGTVVLQNDHIYGNLAEYFADAIRRWPGRFIGLAQVDEATAYQDDQLAALEDQVSRLGMRGLYFTMTAYFRNGYRMLCDDPTYDPLWRLVKRLDLPVFWVHAAKSPAGSYVDEMRRLRRILDRHPGIRHVLIHGVPTSLYADAEDRITWPDEIADVLDQYPVWSEVLYPIAWGGKMDYPYARARTHIRQIYDRFGPGKLIWGSDMPNVARYCTYRQALSYVWDHCDFLSAEDRRRIFRDNTLGLFPGIAASGRAAAD